MNSVIGLRSYQSHQTLSELINHPILQFLRMISSHMNPVLLRMWSYDITPLSEPSSDEVVSCVLSLPSTPSLPFATVTQPFHRLFTMLYQLCSQAASGVPPSESSPSLTKCCKIVVRLKPCDALVSVVTLTSSPADPGAPRAPLAPFWGLSAGQTRLACLI